MTSHRRPFDAESNDHYTDAAPDALPEIARLVAAGRLHVPIAASFPVEKVRAAVELQAGRYVRGNVVVDL